MPEADDWEVSYEVSRKLTSQNEPIAAQPKQRILARPPPTTGAASAPPSTDPNPRYDSAFPALGGAPPGSAPPGALQREGGEGDDDWFRGPQQNNRQLWDTANRATPPTVVAPAAAGPPPRMQILKRPSDAPKSRSTTPQNRPQKTLTQREEEYRLARERIFGSGAGAGEGSGSGTASPSSQPGVRDAQQPQQFQQQQQPQQVGNQGTPGNPGNNSYQRDFRDNQHSYGQRDGSRDQSRESSVSGRPRRGNQTPRSGRTSPDELSRDLAGLSMCGGKPGPTPALRGGMSPGVLRQPRGPSGAGFGRTEPEEEKKEATPSRAEYTRSTSDFSRNTSNNDFNRSAGGGDFNRGANAGASATGDYARSTNANEFSRGDGYRGQEFSRAPPPQVSRSSSYSSSTSQGSYGFAAFDQGRGYVGAVGPPASVGGYATTFQGAYAPYAAQPGFPQQQGFQQPGGGGYYPRPAYAGQQLYGFGAGASPAKNGPGPGPAGFERSAYQAAFNQGLGGGFGVPGGPPGPQQPQQGPAGLPQRPPQQSQQGQGYYRPSPGGGQAYGQ